MILLCGSMKNIFFLKKKKKFQKAKLICWVLATIYIP